MYVSDKCDLLLVLLLLIKPMNQMTALTLQCSQPVKL